MTTAAQGLTRRERLRAATVAEIRREARALLTTEGEEGVTLRAVARRMGLTPAALYRYVDSHEQLMVLVAVDVQLDLVAALEAARDTAEPDPAVRLRAVSREFRRWALEHREEFGQVFANPMPALGAACEGELEEAGQRMGMVFAELVGELVATGRLPVPARDEVDPALLAAVGATVPDEAKGLPVTVAVRFAQAWTRLYGCVAMEVSGQLAWAMADTSPMWELTLRETAEMMGVPDLYAPPG